KLLLSLDTILPAMRPETAEVRIGLKARQENIRHRRDRVVTTKALIKTHPPVAHRSLLQPERTIRTSQPRQRGETKRDARGPASLSAARRTSVQPRRPE